MPDNEITVDDRTISLSNLDKVFFPDNGVSKGDLIDYYRRIAEVMLPHMAGRPISMQRFPDGIAEEGFYQKEAPAYFPEWVERAQVWVEEEESHQPQVICSNAATLVYLANQACITPHVWLSRRDKLYYPDRMVFDLDPPDGDFEPVRSAALAVREALDANGLKSFIMTTGSRGLHVVVPLAREAEFDEVRKGARHLAEQVAHQAPDRLTVEMTKVDRQGRLFLDYLRNSYGQTTVAPYAVRAKPGAPVATPLDWDELDDTGLNSQSYTMQNIFRRLGQKDDPWRDMREQAQSLHGLL
jgi:bifunctional non-homologous end joining protein LigD